MTRLLLPSQCNFLTSQLPKSSAAAPIPIPFHILIEVSNYDLWQCQLVYYAMMVM